MSEQQHALEEMREAVESVLRYTSRGCSSATCDRVRVAWLGNQLRTIGRRAAELSPALRDDFPELPWDRLIELTDESSGTPAGMTADEMQRFVERELPRLRKALKQSRAEG
ncbi:MAG: hypothetical protein E4G93_05805 [Dehalococcoidia bacterium]|nr:MAG: hypothetical protein E4G93_05805 [Dehalococcoidia bacterium]